MRCAATVVELEGTTVEIFLSLLVAGWSKQGQLDDIFTGFISESELKRCQVRSFLVDADEVFVGGMVSHQLGCDPIRIVKLRVRVWNESAECGGLEEAAR